MWQYQTLVQRLLTTYHNIEYTATCNQQSLYAQPVYDCSCRLICIINNSFIDILVQSAASGISWPSLYRLFLMVTHSITKNISVSQYHHLVMSLSVDVRSIIDVGPVLSTITQNVLDYVSFIYIGLIYCIQNTLGHTEIWNECIHVPDLTPDFKLVWYLWQLILHLFSYLWGWVFSLDFLPSRFTMFSYLWGGG